MWSKIFNVVDKAIKPITDMVDDVHTSEEEKQKLKNNLVQIKNQITSEMIGVQKEELKAKKEMATAETKSKSIWDKWRKIIALGFGITAVIVILVNHVLAPGVNLILEINKVMVEKMVEGQVVEVVAAVPKLDLPKEIWNLLTKLLTFGFLGKSAEITAGRLSPSHNSNLKEDAD